MHKISVFFFGAILAVASAGRYAPAIPAPEYGVPVAPAPVYGLPAKVELPPPQLITSYDYKVYTPPRHVEVLAPYAPAHPVPAPLPLPVPVPVHHPAPVYGPPAPVYGPPAPVYGAPHVEYVKPIEPITTAYSYVIPPYVPKLVNHYPAPVPVYGVPNYQVPAVPAVAYGPPQVGHYPPSAPHNTYGAPHH